MNDPSKMLSLIQSHVPDLTRSYPKVSTRHSRLHVSVTTEQGQVQLTLGQGGEVIHHRGEHNETFQAREAADVLAPFGALGFKPLNTLNGVWQQALSIALGALLTHPCMIAGVVPHEGGLLLCGHMGRYEVFTVMLRPEGSGAVARTRVWKRGVLIAEQQRPLGVTPNRFLD